MTSTRRRPCSFTEATGEELMVPAVAVMVAIAQRKGLIVIGPHEVKVTAARDARGYIIETVPPPGDRSSRSVPPLRLSLVIPTYNESKNIGELVERLTALLDPPLGEGYELVVVDDDSPDRTWELAESMTARYPKLRVLRRQR